MMPSVIPARLQFQCGHAALVTLPRVKGETATQRNDRVAREKSSALGRLCDFCAPVNGTNHIEQVELAEMTNGTNGTNHAHAAEVIQAPVVTESVVPVSESPLSELEIVVPEEFDPDSGMAEVELPGLESGESLESSVPEEEEVIVEVVTIADEEPAAEPVEAPQRRRRGRPATGRTATTAPKASRKPRAQRAPRAARTPKPVETAEAATVRAQASQFRVEYRVERIVRADSIQDALRQVSRLGAADVFEITRAD